MSRYKKKVEMNHFLTRPIKSIFERTKWISIFQDNWTHPQNRMNASQNTQIPLVWYFTPNNRRIECRRLSADSTGSLFPVIKPMLHCEHIDTTCIQIDDHTRYIVWYNDVGAYEQEPFNLAANQVLKKIYMNWGASELCGWYVVTKETLDPAWWDPEKVTEEMWEQDRDGGWKYADMDLSPKEWIRVVNIAITKNVEARNKMMKELNMRVISVV